MAIYFFQKEKYFGIMVDNLKKSDIMYKEIKNIVSKPSESSGRKV